MVPHATTYSPDSFSLEYRPEQRMLIGRWLRPVTLDELKAHYHALLAAAIAHDNCCHWLLDVRRRVAIDTDAALWFREEFGPQLPLVLGRPVWLAYFAMVNQELARTNPALRENMRLGSLQDGHYCYFNQESEALAWLAQQR
ncbi:hypothetical protein [Hymenobacter baengnokdamensis]|uniref:hypothetical protein n=1 Tax=Hymenobacter baengnokdamensis TaxID=2615203 RepID=UPI00124918F6|nr:hypothetical protein [Hymenobacter baengnokdamensis]